MVSNLPILSTIIFLPIIGGAFLLLFKDDNKSVKVFSLITSLLSCYFCLKMYLNFYKASWQLQLVENAPWIPDLGIYYRLGVDGFSVALIMLTTLMTLLVIIASFNSVKDRLTKYLSAFLIMQGLMCGVFAAADMILFYIFFEGMLIPMFLIIGLWGGKNRIYATFKFFLYTFLGSVLFLVGLIYLHVKARTIGVSLDNSFEIASMYRLKLSIAEQSWLFFAFLLAFAIKVPMFPVHTWLPDAHTEAPTGGSVILAAITLKMGGYGFLRFILPILPDAADKFSPLVIALSLIAIVYIGFVAIVQNDMKKLIAYSSISHMGFVTLGCMIVFKIVANTKNLENAALGIDGAVMQMISHGFISAALFLCVGVLYDRMHSRLIKDYGGVANSMPIFAAFFMLFALANTGLPGTSGFVGEFLVIVSSFQANFWFAFLAAITLILGASYTLWMYKRVIFGEIRHEAVGKLTDLTSSEIFVFVILGALVLGFGIYPAPILDLIHQSSQHLVTLMLKSKI